MERFILLVTRPIIEYYLCDPVVLLTFMERFCYLGAFWLHVVLGIIEQAWGTMSYGFFAHRNPLLKFRNAGES